ncbi:MAG: hypothetical protein OXR66_01840 [Candidatus Woesearchaeota archaeon]|nr:hypothetical protein [Candidatus Woesearchaeota archaeon]
MSRTEFCKKVVLLLVLLVLFQLLTTFFSMEIISLAPLGAMLAHSVCALQHLEGVSCTVEGTVINYDGVRVFITSLCTGVDQVLFVAILLFVFFGFTERTVLYVLGGIFILNLARLTSFYPLTQQFGYDVVTHAYIVSYEYVQGIVLLVITVLFILRRGARAAQTRSRTPRVPRPR